MTRNHLLLLSMCLGLVACETGKATTGNRSTVAQTKLSMIDISRGLSNGAVDVYESEGQLLTKPVPPSGKNFVAGAVPKSQDILTTDPNVVIYDSSTGQPIKTQTQNSIQEIELVIPPIGLPDLQPPVEALGELPSPFDGNGDLLPDEKRMNVKHASPPKKPNKI